MADDKDSSSKEIKLKKMPSGAMQYARGDTSSDRLKTIADLDAGTFNVDKDYEPNHRLSQAFLDEVDDSNDSEVKKAKGGMVRGTGCAVKGHGKIRMH